MHAIETITACVVFIPLVIAISGRLVSKADRERRAEACESRQAEDRELARRWDARKA